DELVWIRRSRTREPTCDGRATRVVRRRAHFAAAVEALQQLVQVRGTELEVEVGNRDPLRIEGDVEAACGECGGARQQLREAPGTGGRQGLGVEHTLVTNNDNEQQRADAERGRLGFYRPAMGPRKNRAEHAGIVGRLEHRLPSEAHRRRAEATGGERAAPRQQVVEIELGRAPEDGAHLRLGGGIETGEEERVDATERRRDWWRRRGERGRRDMERRQAQLASRAEPVVSDRILARQRHPRGPRRGRIAAEALQLAEPEAGAPAAGRTRGAPASAKTR